MMTSLKIALAAGFVALGAANAHAQMQVPGKQDPALVQPGAYQVEPRHTRVLFSVNHLGFSTYFGDFTGVSGSLTIDPEHVGSDKLAVTVPMDTISTTNTALDGELKGADWFDVAKFPTATFESTSIKSLGPDTADVMGNLTLHGQTHPVTLHVTFKGAGMNPADRHFTVGFDAHGQIKRTEFGVTKLSPLVSDDVELILSGAFIKAAS